MRQKTSLLQAFNKLKECLEFRDCNKRVGGTKLMIPCSGPTIIKCNSIIIILKQEIYLLNHLQESL